MSLPDQFGREHVPLGGPASDQEVAHLYDRLRQYMNANDRARVEETCQALLLAGQPFSEILKRRSTSAVEGQALAPDTARASPYHWGSQWNVKADLRQDPPITPAAPEPHRAAGSPGTMANTRPPSAVPAFEPDLPISSRRDLIEEWQARQHVEPRAPNDMDGADTRKPPSINLEQSPLVSEMEELVSDTGVAGGERETSRRSAVKLLPIAGIYGGAAVVVSLGLFLIVDLTFFNFQAKPTLHIPALEDSPGNRDAPVWKTARSANAAEFSEPKPEAMVTEGAPADQAQATADTLRAGPVERTSSAAAPSGALVAEPTPTTSVSPTAVAEPNSTARIPPESSRPSIAKLNGTPSETEVGPPEASDQDTTAAQTAALPAEEGGRVASLAPHPFDDIGLPSTKPPEPEPVPTSAAVNAAAFLTRGDALIATGDIASARLFYERAVDAGDAEAAIRLGETFDPAFLAHARLNGIRGDPATALKWYKRARELGASEADILVMSIERE